MRAPPLRRMRCCFSLCAVIALGVSCQRPRSTLRVDVTLEPAETPVKTVRIEVKQDGRRVVERVFAWQPQRAKLGIFLPGDVSGDVQALGWGLDDGGGIIAAGEGRGAVISGNVSDAVPLILRATRPAPSNPGDPDGGTPDAGVPGDGPAEAARDAPDDGDVPDAVDAPDQDGQAADRPPTDHVTFVSEIGGTDGPDDQTDAAADAVSGIVTPPDLGRYCSMLFGLTGWALSWVPNLTDDPCQSLRAQHGAGTVQHAGMYSLFGINEVVVRCDAGASWVWLWYGPGESPFNITFDKAAMEGHAGCVFTAAPHDLPIFGPPFQGAPEIQHATGVDFARPPYTTLNLSADFGQPGASMTASVVNNRAQDRGGLGYIDNHDGHDLNVPVGTPIVAVADGTVLAARFRDVTRQCTTRASDTQGEVFIKHVVPGGANSNAYDEAFVSFYAHFSTIAVTAGQPVRRGQVIGESGNTGCSTAPHLHLGVFRLTNTAGASLFPFTINSDFTASQDQSSSNGYQVVIDPYGFDPGAAGFDPWAWLAYPWGALSINLWMPGAAPPTGNW